MSLWDIPSVGGVWGGLQLNWGSGKKVLLFVTVVCLSAKQHSKVKKN